VLKLNLDGNPMSHSVIDPVQGLEKPLSRLQSLSICECALDQTDFQNVAFQISHNLTSLKRLDIGRCGKQGIQSFIDCISSNMQHCSLRKLDYFHEELENFRQEDEQIKGLEHVLFVQAVLLTLCSVVDVERICRNSSLRKCPKDLFSLLSKMLYPKKI
jgi:hypothetical protein